jgi:hypothetical protein
MHALDTVLIPAGKLIGAKNVFGIVVTDGKKSTVFALFRLI